MASIGSEAIRPTIGARMLFLVAAFFFTLVIALLVGVEA